MNDNVSHDDSGNDSVTDNGDAHVSDSGDAQQDSVPTEYPAIDAALAQVQDLDHRPLPEQVTLLTKAFEEISAVLQQSAGTERP